MAPVSVLGFVMITAIVCSGTTARLVRKEGDKTPDSWGTYRPCTKIYGDCTERFVDRAYVRPSFQADGKLIFPDDFFNRFCGFLRNNSVCYELTQSEPCEPDFPSTDIMKNFGKLSIKVCRNTDDLNTLVRCLNDRDFYLAFISIISKKGGVNGLSCDDAKKQVGQILRLVEDSCGADEYTNLKAVLTDIGSDLPSFFLKREDPNCSIEVGNFTP